MSLEREFCELHQEMVDKAAKLLDVWFKLPEDEETVPIEYYPYREDFHELLLHMLRWQEELNQWLKSKV